MSFFAVAPQELVKIMKVELQKKREEEEKEEKAETEAAEDAKPEAKPEADVRQLYEHPQSRLFSKMAALVGGKPVTNLPVDPADAPGHEVRVMDRKLEEDEERLKKDNKRWKGIIYLTIAVSVIILCLVVAQVISSVTSSKNTLPNIDVAEPKNTRLRAEPLVAAMPQLDATENGRQTLDPPETVEADIVEIDTILNEEKQNDEENKEKEEEEKPAPVSQDTKGDEEESSSTAPTPTSPTKRKPFFMPIMFGQGQISFKNPMAEFLRGSPPFHSERPPHSLLDLLLGGRRRTPTDVDDDDDPLMTSDIEVVEEVTAADEEDPFFQDMLHGMQSLLETVRPLLDQQPLPQQLSLSRQLPPQRGRALFPPPPRDEFGRGFRPPPAAFRPGPFRRPVSVVRPANRRPPFPPPPTNQRALPRPGQVRLLQSPRPLPPFFSSLRQSGSARHFTPDRQPPPRLVGNPLYSYPNTATGIQDIIHFIRHGGDPQHRSSNNRHSVGYSGPIYPDGYDGRRAHASSPPPQPFHLMLDVYPAENEDRYTPLVGQGGPLAVEQGTQPQVREQLFGGLENSLDAIFPDDMPLPDVQSGDDGFQQFLIPEGRALHVGAPHIPETPNRPPFEHNVFLNPGDGRQGKSFPFDIQPQQVTVIKKVIVPVQQPEQPQLSLASPLVQIRPQPAVQRPMDRVPVVNYAPPAQDRVIPLQRAGPQMPHLHVKDHGMDGVNVPQEGRVLPLVQTFPMEQVQQPQGRGFPLPSHRLPLQNEPVHMMSEVPPAPLITHQQTQAPQHVNIEHHHLAQHRQSRPRLHSESLTQARELPVTLIHEHKAIPQRISAAPPPHVMPPSHMSQMGAPQPHMNPPSHMPQMGAPQPHMNPPSHMLQMGAPQAHMNPPSHVTPSQMSSPHPVEMHDHDVQHHAQLLQPPRTPLYRLLLDDSPAARPPHMGEADHPQMGGGRPVEGAHAEGRSFLGGAWNHGFHK